jgi:hypothetical protein
MATMQAVNGFIKGFGWGVLSLVAVLAAALISPLLDDGHSGLWLGWVYANLGLSILPFAAIAMVFTYQLRQLKLLLIMPIQHPDTASIEKIIARDHWLDLLTGLFFGVGVIWTAIGMRSALLTALGGLDAELAQSLGAFEILQRLVEGGILLALSTTIVGGVGGYLFKVIKSLYLGAQLKAVYLAYQQYQQDEVVNVLKQLVTQQGSLANAVTQEASPDA